jgi:flagellar protein FliL
MSKKWWIIVLVNILVLAVIGGGLFYVQGQRSGPENRDAAGVTKPVANKEPENRNRVNFPLDSFIVNLADPGGKRYLSTRIVLELNDKKVVPSLEKKVPEMRDKILIILPTQTFEDIQSVEGKNALRATLISALNDILEEGQITNIFFQEFVVQ